MLDTHIPTYERWLGILKDTQRERGHADDFLLKLDKLDRTHAAMHEAQATLAQEGVIDQMVVDAATARAASIAQLTQKIVGASNEFMAQNARNQLEKRFHPKRKFMNGTAPVARFTK